jgi:hypothetical protein
MGLNWAISTITTVTFRTHPSKSGQNLSKGSSFIRASQKSPPGSLVASMPPPTQRPGYRYEPYWMPKIGLGLGRCQSALIVGPSRVFVGLMSRAIAI